MQVSLIEIRAVNCVNVIRDEIAAETDNDGRESITAVLCGFNLSFGVEIGNVLKF